jgi:hypothetical protein
MADQLKEIFNADTYLNSFSGASKTIVTTNSTTQYMIKDVQVGANTIPGTEALTVNGVPVAASLATSVAGSEIVDVSSTVALQLPATPVYTKLLYNSMRDGYGTGSFSTDAAVYTAAINSNSSSTAVTTVSAALAASIASVGGEPTIEHWFVGSDFYYWTNNSNNTWAFYKRTGGINGTETLLKKSDNTGTITQNPGQYGWVLYSATANKFYLYGTSRIVVTYDPTNNTSSSVATSAPSHSTYYRATLSNNGLIFVIPSTGYSTQVYAINPANGLYITFNGLYDWNIQEVGADAGMKILVHFSGTQYFIWRTQSINSAYWYLASTNPAVVPTFPSSSSTTYSNYISNVGGPITIGGVGGNIVAQLGQGYLPDTYSANNAAYVYVVTPSATAPTVASFSMTTGAVTVTTLTGIYIGSGRGFKTFSPTASATGGEIASTTNFPQLIRLRVTGVETTL